MNTILWVVQALLAAVFLFAGGMKFFGIEGSQRRGAGTR